jgi:aminoglycoside 6'-N-acetyltransferase I
MRLSDESISVRIAIPADIDGILDIQRRSPGRSSTPAFKDYTVRAIKDATSLFVVAEAAGEPLGWAMTKAFADADVEAPSGHYLMGITVAPEFRRQGVATQLVRARLDWIRARDDRAYYFTNERNLASIALHARLGFREIARARQFRRVTFDGGTGILFSLDLQTAR